jgi:transposase
MPGVRFSAEQRAKAVRLVAEAAPQHESPWAAIESVAAKIGASAETVRKWVRRAEVDAGQRPGMTSEEHAEIKRLRREVTELRRATEIIFGLTLQPEPDYSDMPQLGTVRQQPDPPIRTSRLKGGPPRTPRGEGFLVEDIGRRGRAEAARRRV